MANKDRNALNETEELKREVAAKDAETARLANIINAEYNKCGDCAKFGGDCSAGDVDGNEDCRACSRFASNQIASLRSLVNELADALDAVVPDHADCEDTKALCSGGCMPDGFCRQDAVRALVSKAREVVNG